MTPLAPFSERPAGSAGLTDHEVTVPVTVGEPRDNVLLVTSGLTPGQTIVTAGVHLLKPGQKVMPMAPADQPSAQSAITPRR